MFAYPLAFRWQGLRNHFIKLGCGTALPTSYLLQRVLANKDGNVHFTLADYNIDVLQLVTIPNLLLSWKMINETTQNASQWTVESDIEITPELLNDFTATLDGRRISIDAVSGAWCESFVALACNFFPIPSKRLVLASETIYSPTSLTPFANVLHDALRTAPDAHALVAAKRVYFGVGGGMDDFVQAMESFPGVRTLVRVMTTEGVTRVIVEVDIHHD